MIIARLQEAKALKDAGLYKWKALVTSVIGLLSGLAVFSTLTPAMIPEFMHPYYPYLVGIGRTATIIGMVAGVVLAQTSDKVLPKVRESLTPSLRDNERDEPQ